MPRSIKITDIITQEELNSILDNIPELCETLLNDTEALKKAVLDCEIIQDSAGVFKESRNDLNLDEALSELNLKSNSSYSISMYERHSEKLKSIGFARNLLNSDVVKYAAILHYVTSEAMKDSQLKIMDMVNSNTIDSDTATALMNELNKKVEVVIAPILLQDYERQVLLKEYNVLLKYLEYYAEHDTALRLDPADASDNNKLLSAEFIADIILKLKNLPISPDSNIKDVNICREKLYLLKNDIQMQIGKVYFSKQAGNHARPTNKMTCIKLGEAAFRRLFPNLTTVEKDRQEAIKKAEDSLSIASTTVALIPFEPAVDYLAFHVSSVLDPSKNVDSTRLFNDYYISDASNHLLRALFEQLASMNDEVRNYLAMFSDKDKSAIAKYCSTFIDFDIESGTDFYDRHQLINSGGHPVQNLINLACNIFLDDFIKLILDEHGNVNTKFQQAIGDENYQALLHKYNSENSDLNNKLLTAFVILLSQIFTATIPELPVRDIPDHDLHIIHNNVLENYFKTPIGFYAHNVVTVESFKQDKAQAYDTLNELNNNLDAVIDNLKTYAQELRAGNEAIIAQQPKNNYFFPGRANYFNKKINAIAEAVTELESVKIHLDSKLKNPDTNIFLLTAQATTSLSNIIEEKLLNKNELKDIHGKLESILIKILKICYKLVGKTYIPTTDTLKEEMDKGIKDKTSAAQKLINAHITPKESKKETSIISGRAVTAEKDTEETKEEPSTTPGNSDDTRTTRRENVDSMDIDSDDDSMEVDDDPMEVDDSQRNSP